MTQKSAYYFWRYFIPGLALVFCAFWAGTQESMVWAFLGFLSFFVAGISLIVEGLKRKKQELE